MTYNYYIYKNGSFTNVFIYNNDTNKTMVYDVTQTPSGYYCRTESGKPDDKYLVKANISDFHSMWVIGYLAIRTNHDDYWWDYDVGTWVKTPNDERFKYNKIGDKYFMEYEPFRPRYRVYRYRGEIYIWCCDEHVIRRIHSSQFDSENWGIVTKVEYTEFEATDNYHASLETDWEFLAEFNTWYDCFYHRYIRFKTYEEMITTETESKKE